MNRILCLILLSTLLLHTKEYNNSLLDIHSKIYPKLLLADKGIKDKLVDKTIIVSILYRENDFNIAQQLKRSMLGYYPKIKNYNFKVILQRYDTFDISQRITSYYFLHADANTISNITQLLIKKSIISFSYDSDYLNNGVIMSLHVGKKTSPYINLIAIKESSIVLKNIIYKIAKIK